MAAPGLWILLVMDSVTAKMLLITAEEELCFLVMEGAVT